VKHRRGSPAVLLEIAVLLISPLLLQCTPTDSSTDQTSASTTKSSATAYDLRLHENGGALYIDNPDRLPLLQVDRVIDGDTLDVRVGDATARIRVFGLAAPERDEPCGPAATEALRRAAGNEVRLLQDRRIEDEYGRELRYVFTPEGRSIDAELIADGAAGAWHDDGAYRDTLVRIEANARQSGEGCLWG
jgi:endonuclease YncB( thermonuclease family)